MEQWNKTKQNYKNCYDWFSDTKELNLTFTLRIQYVASILRVYSK